MALISTPDTDTRSRNLNQLRGEALELLARGKPLGTVLAAITRAVETIATEALCSVLLVDAEGCLRHGAAPRLPDFYIKAVDGLAIGEGIGSCGTAAFRAERVIAEDLAVHPYWAPYRELVATAGLASCWSEPILAADGRVLGTFGIYHSRPAVPDVEDMFIIGHAAQLAGIAIEHHRAREQAMRYQGELEAIIDNIPMMVFTKEPRELRFTHFNRTGAALMGVPKADLIGRNDFDFVPREQATFFTEVDRRVLASGEPVDLPVEVMDTPHLGRRLLHTRKVPIYDEDGSPRLLLGVSEDITERHQVEENLRLAGIIFDQADEGIVVTDEEFRVLKVNPRFCSMIGAAADKLIGRRAEEIPVLPEVRHRVREAMESASAHGQWRGELSVVHRDGNTVHTVTVVSALYDDTGKARHHVAMLSDISELKEQQKKLERLAHYDVLTGLPNRVLLGELLAEAMARATAADTLLAVCYLDLDGFKPINDSYGHQIGDDLLAAVADRLRDCLPAVDVAARIGGDEFVLLLSGFEDMRACREALPQLHGMLSQPYRLLAGEFQLGASLGISVYPLDGSEPDVLIRQADQAMYQAKLAGRQRIQFFDVGNAVRDHARSTTVEVVRGALARGELRLHYQPKIDLRSNVVVGFEALARRLLPSGEVLAPHRFLEAIAGTEMEIVFGEWSIGEALRQLDAWRQLGLDTAVSVNISPRHLLDSRFLDVLRESLARWPSLRPSQLELEVLESAALQNLRHSRKVLEGCRALGVSVALDDFGTGYSSLSYLRHLPAQTVKVDQSFVRDMANDPDDRAIVEAVIRLAQTFSLTVVAEGVETAEIQALLIHLGCDQAQGYGIARPMDADAVPGWLAAYTAGQDPAAEPTRDTLTGRGKARSLRVG